MSEAFTPRQKAACKRLLDEVEARRNAAPPGPEREALDDELDALWAEFEDRA